MITTGSKLLIGSATAATLFAVVYGVAQGGALGTIGLISAAVALWLLAGLNLYVRDSNISAMDHESFESAPAAQATAQPSLWPLVIGLGATTLTLGLVTYRAIFILGLIALTAGALEWLVHGWSERASADDDYNAEARGAIIDPLEMPVAAAAGAGIIVYAFSRVMLGLPSKTATVAAFAIVAALVIAIGAAVWAKRDLSKSTLAGTFSLAVIALIAGGAVAGLNGERETHPHETPADLAEENACGTEETEADEKASQTVAGKSSVAAEIIFDGAELVADVPGSDGDFSELTLPRSNPSNVLFRNDSDEHARLVLELHPATDADGVPLGPERICTSLTEDGGVQFLTVEFDRPTFAVEAETGEGYAFTVAGSDVELGVVVP